MKTPLGGLPPPPPVEEVVSEISISVSSLPKEKNFLNSLSLSPIRVTTSATLSYRLVNQSIVSSIGILIELKNSFIPSAPRAKAPTIPSTTSSVEPKNLFTASVALADIFSTWAINGLLTKSLNPPNIPLKVSLPVPSNSRNICITFLITAIIGCATPFITDPTILNISAKKPKAVATLPTARSTLSKVLVEGTRAFINLLKASIRLYIPSPVPLGKAFSIPLPTAATNVCIASRPEYIPSWNSSRPPALSILFMS